MPAIAGQQQRTSGRYKSGAPRKRPTKEQKKEERERAAQRLEQRLLEGKKAQAEVVNLRLALEGLRAKLPREMELLRANLAEETELLQAAQAEADALREALCQEKTAREAACAAAAEGLSAAAAEVATLRAEVLRLHGVAGWEQQRRMQVEGELEHYRAHDAARRGRANRLLNLLC